MDFGSKINPDDIEENDDVYFECKIHANPPAYKVVWKHNVSIVVVLILLIPEPDNAQNYSIKCFYKTTHKDVFFHEYIKGQMSVYRRPSAFGATSPVHYTMIALYDVINSSNKYKIL